MTQEPRAAPRGGRGRVPAWPLALAPSASSLGRVPVRPASGRCRTHRRLWADRRAPGPGGRHDLLRRLGGGASRAPAHRLPSHMAAPGLRGHTWETDGSRGVSDCPPPTLPAPRAGAGRRGRRCTRRPPGSGGAAGTPGAAEPQAGVGAAVPSLRIGTAEEGALDARLGSTELAVGLGRPVLTCRVSGGRDGVHAEPPAGRGPGRRNAAPTGSAPTACGSRQGRLRLSHVSGST